MGDKIEICITMSVHSSQKELLRTIDGLSLIFPRFKSIVVMDIGNIYCVSIGLLRSVRLVVRTLLTFFAVTLYDLRYEEMVVFAKEHFKL